MEWLRFGSGLGNASLSLANRFSPFGPTWPHHLAQRFSKREMFNIIMALVNVTYF
jgi:hypothetical protein